jgi:hypothetical protein
MAFATTAAYHQMTLEVEGTTGVFSKVCGIKGFSVSRSSDVEEFEIPDCADDAVPFSVEKSVKRLNVGVSGSGFWAAESHDMMMEWYYSGQTKNIRIRHVNAPTGSTEYETGPAFLTQLDHERGDDKGKKSASITLAFNGTPTRTDKA